MRLRSTTTALVLTLGLGLLAGCGDDGEAQGEQPTASDPADPPTSEPSNPPSSEPEPPSPEPTSEPAPSGEAVPVYFTGESPVGTRLYREFHDVESGDPLTAAAGLLVAGDALDPDYGTLLTGVTVAGVEQGDGEIVVTLSEDSATSADKSVAPKDAALAVQSLVYTLQGVAQTRDPVRVQLADGTPVDLLDQPTSAGMKAGKELDVLSLVNVTTPEEGAVASGTLAVEGVASSFEATVPFHVEDASGKEVLRDFATAEGWIDGLYPWQAEVDVSELTPGNYTFVAMTDDPSGGAEGPGAFADTKTFTIE